MPQILTVSHSTGRDAAAWGMNCHHGAPSMTEPLCTFLVDRSLLESTSQPGGGGRRTKRRQVCHWTFWVAAILVTSQSNQAQAFRFWASLLDAQRWEWPFCTLHSRMPVTGRHTAHSPWRSCPQSRTAAGCVYQSLQLLSVAESGKSTGTQNKNSSPLQQ